MGAYYDTYDYSSYWNGREYEHGSEVIAINNLLSKIPKIDRALEIGGGYGRLVPTYVYRVRQVILSEPSAKLLALAKKRLSKFKNIKFIQSTLENLDKKVRPKSIDVILMVRVMHHITEADKAFASIEKLLDQNGYLILEFANKIHFKKVTKELLNKNFKFWSDKEPIDVRSNKSIKQKTIAFLNYHPKQIEEKLAKYNMEIVETLSVSNIRNPFFKKHLPTNVLLDIERVIQKPLSYVYFGPSVFILARKKG